MDTKYRTKQQLQKEKKVFTVTLRMNKDDLEKLHELTTSTGLTQSKCIRNMINKHLCVNKEVSESLIPIIKQIQMLNGTYNQDPIRRQSVAEIHNKFNLLMKQIKKEVN